ncbi:hypothetical protein PFISCL1PPCAC_807, partial [Pristionchus fissidentatus]
VVLPVPASHNDIDYRIHHLWSFHYHDYRNHAADSSPDLDYGQFIFYNEYWYLNHCHRIVHSHYFWLNDGDVDSSHYEYHNYNYNHPVYYYDLWHLNNDSHGLINVYDNWLNYDYNSSHHVNHVIDYFRFDLCYNHGKYSVHIDDLYRLYDKYDWGSHHDYYSNHNNLSLRVHCDYGQFGHVRSG